MKNNNNNWKKDREYLLDNIGRLPDVFKHGELKCDLNTIKRLFKYIWRGYEIHSDIVFSTVGATLVKCIGFTDDSSIAYTSTKTIEIADIVKKLKNTEKQKVMENIFMKVKFVYKIDPPKNFYVVLSNSGESVDIRTFKPYAFIRSTVEHGWKKDYPTLYKTIEKNARGIWDYTMNPKYYSYRIFEWRFQDGKLTRKEDEKVKFSLWKYYRNLEEIKGFVNPVHTYYSLLYDLINNNGSNIANAFDENTGFFRSFKEIDSYFDKIDFINNITEQRDIECICYTLQTFNNISHKEIKKALKSTKELVKEYLTEI